MESFFPFSSHLTIRNSCIQRTENNASSILEQTSVAENGEIVVALIDDSATVKRFFKENGHYRLQPENATMDPIIVDKVQILGKVIGLLRLMR